MVFIAKYFISARSNEQCYSLIVLCDASIKYDLIHCHSIDL